jgi:hypothetical protein
MVCTVFLTFQRVFRLLKDNENIFFRLCLILNYKQVQIFSIHFDLIPKSKSKME